MGGSKTTVLKSEGTAGSSAREGHDISLVSSIEKDLVPLKASSCIRPLLVNEKKGLFLFFCI